MNYLGIDYGAKRIGLSFGDDELRLAVPIEAAVEVTEEGRLQHIERVIRERRIGAMVVGYPYNMDGSVGSKAREVDTFIQRLNAFGLPLYKMDERLTSSQAESDWRQLGQRRSPKRQQKVRKAGHVDSAAAALILQDYLDLLIGDLIEHVL
ncbi:MAG: hypothetical protein A2Y14_01655 [Verrucomicrobia bacterium GWF2_51_19]|nr:MAG: hypothetical protein A2Y14_01655 [Verrucomicrobia bacterium GWF2_51_19]HCJ11521.1 Holliday junction resolvase RuvX [Opitutae bacterium]